MSDHAMEWMRTGGQWLLFFIAMKSIIFGQYWPWQKCRKCGRKLNRHYCSAAGECEASR